jgi:hypothetical protein
VPATERTLALIDAVAGLFADHTGAAALRRGTTIGCLGPSAHALALAVAAGPTQHGSWVACAGCPGLGLQAAAEFGVDLRRVVAVPTARAAAWADVLAAMIDGFDVLVIGSAVGGVGRPAARRLQARAQARGVVMLALGDRHPFEVDLRLSGTSAWLGLADGHGVARARRVDARIEGRRVAQPRQASLWLPDITGSVAPAVSPVGPPVREVAEPAGLVAVAS